MRKLLACAALLCTFTLYAGDPPDSLQLVMQKLQYFDSIDKTFTYKTGRISLSNGLATINLQPGYRFLEAKDAKYVLEELWGNLKGSSTLGMIVPGEQSAILADYAFLVEYQPIGYVKDKDADDINYEDLLKEMKEEQVKANEERRKAGLEELNLVGWASRPFYDKAHHTLYWAKEYEVPGTDEHTLNYDMRILGRKGILTIQAISGMSQLDSVKKNVNPLLSMVAFEQGNRYADFDSNTDEVAAWTLGALVAGKVLAKVGFFALLLKYLKFIILGVAGLGGFIWRKIRGRKKEEEAGPVYDQPAPAETVE